MELGVELAAVIRLDSLYPKRQSRKHVIYEINSVLLVILFVNLEHAQPSAIINSGELPIAFTFALDGC